MKKREIKRALKNAIAVGLPIWEPRLARLKIMLRTFQHRAEVSQVPPAKADDFKKTVKTAHNGRFFDDLQFQHKELISPISLEQQIPIRITWLQLMCEMFIERLCQAELEIQA